MLVGSGAAVVGGANAVDSDGDGDGYCADDVDGDDDDDDDDDDCLGRSGNEREHDKLTLAF